MPRRLSLFPPKFSLGIFPLALVAAVALLPVPSLGAGEAPGAASGTPLTVTTDTVRHAKSTSLDVAPIPPNKRFWRATGEMIVVGYSPWLYSHYIIDADYADISMDSVHDNFSEGFWFDGDNFRTNQWGHPYQGSLYYNAGRINGFNFWESSAFCLVGDLGWELFMETERPSYNDTINTWLGGTNRGEVSYRLSQAIIDNEATGWNKFWRELGAGMLNPVNAIDRAVFGDMWKKHPNAPDRFPSKLFMVVDAGYGRGRSGSPEPNKGAVSLTLRQNDPHVQPIKKPFDYFDVESMISLTPGPLIPMTNIRGLLAGWDLVDEADVHHMFSPGLTYNYFDNSNAAFGGQGMDLTLLSRWKLSDGFEVRTEAGGAGYVYAAIQTDYVNDTPDGVGRNYDFGSGGGPKMDFRIRRDDVDWLKASVSAGWFSTDDGASSQNRIFLVNTEGRLPISDDLYAGVGWSYQERYTLYDHVPSVTQANSVIRFFLTWAFRIV